MPQPQVPGSSKKLLVWLGPHFFSSRMPQFGWEVILRPHEPGRIRGWSHILNLTGGRVPDVVLVSDASLPPHVTGMESFPCLTLFYAVDSHIHSWYPLYAQGFDACLVSLKDHIPLFGHGFLPPDRIWWSPPYARDQDRPPSSDAGPPKEWDLLFVGTVDRNITPERYQFINRLKEVFPGLMVTKGAFPQLFPKAKLLLNECFRGDLNFRVFEALGCGGCLLTPAIENGLPELFSDGRELFLYPQHDVAFLADLTRSLLADDALRLQTAQNGLVRVDAAHRSSHRAKALHERLTAFFSTGEARRIVETRKRSAPDIHASFLRLLYLHHAETTAHPALRTAYLEAAKGHPARE